MLFTIINVKLFVMCIVLAFLLQRYVKKRKNLLSGVKKSNSLSMDKFFCIQDTDLEQLTFVKYLKSKSIVGNVDESLEFVLLNLFHCSDQDKEGENWLQANRWDILRYLGKDKTVRYSESDDMSFQNIVKVDECYVSLYQIIKLLKRQNMSREMKFHLSVLSNSACIFYFSAYSYDSWCRKPGQRLVFERVSIERVKKPNFIKVNGRGEFHNENGACISWRDKELYCLNNTVIDKKYIPLSKVDYEEVIKEQNVDVLAVLIKNIGIDNIVKECHGVQVDIWIDPKTSLVYELKELTVGDHKERYLIYDSASVPGLVHVSAVPPQTRSAIAGRSYMLGILDISDLQKDFDEKAIIKCLPEEVS